MKATVRVVVNGVAAPVTSSGAGQVLAVAAAPRAVVARSLWQFAMPSGYPRSVTPDYLPHQAWTFVKNCASASTYVLSTQCLLTAVGMQSEAALPISAAANWVLKDGLGSLGVMVAASRFGRVLDSRVKAARWVSELGMIGGVALEMATPLCPAPLFLPLASLANTCKGLAALSGGASKAAFHRHFARSGNLADVTAQSHSQHTAAYTVGTAGGVLLTLAMAGAASSFSSWMLFALLSAVQMFAVHKATAAVALSSLDAVRGPALMRQFLSKGRVSTPEEMRLAERFEWPFVSHSTRNAPIVGASPLVFETASKLQEAIDASRGRPFLLHWSGRRASVVLRSSISDEEVVEAVYCASQLGVSHCAACPPFAEFARALREAGWTTDNNSMETASRQTRAEWN